MEFSMLFLLMQVSLLYDLFRLLNVSQALMSKVRVVQSCIMTVLCEQAIVIPFLDDASFFHHNDPVSSFHCGQTMRDEDAR